MPQYRVTGSLTDPAIIEARAPIVAARQYAVEHELGKTTVIAVQSESGRLARYKIGSQPAIVLPLGRLMPNERYDGTQVGELAQRLVRRSR